MENLCTACLCTGRKLYLIGETGCQNLYLQILREVPVYDFSVNLRVCWECRATLRRFLRFKARVQTCYRDLLQHLHQNFPPLDQLIHGSHLEIKRLSTISFPEDELECSIKQEVDCDALPLELPPEQEWDPKEANRSKKSAKQKYKHRAKEELPQKKKRQQKKSTEEVKTEDSESAVDDDDVLYDSDHSFDADDGHKEEQKTEELAEEKGTEAEEQVDTEKENKVVPEEKPKEKLPELIGNKLKCPDCGKMFSSRKTYRYHVNTLHKGQNRYPCPRCGKIYQWKSNLGRHMRSHKAKDSGELYCETCDKRFASVATYRQHLRISRRHVSESEFSFSCAECGKKFVNKTRLRDHVDWDHLHKVKFVCTLCHKPFKCHTSLYVHVQNVHRNKKKDNLCHICGKSYQNAAKLKCHIVAMHTSETPYRCGTCTAAFGWYSSLYRHMREVHHKMKMQPKKMRKPKRSIEALPPMMAQDMLPPGH